MYTISAEQDIDATLDAVWAVQTDVRHWPDWNSHELDARLDGEFVAGTTGWSKPRGGPGASWLLTDATPPSATGGIEASWASRSALPGGALTGRRTFTRISDGTVRCAYEMRATGPFEVVFRWWFGPRIRRDMAVGFAELQAEVARRGAGS